MRSDVTWMIICENYGSRLREIGSASISIISPIVSPGRKRRGYATRYKARSSGLKTLQSAKIESWSKFIPIGHFNNPAQGAICSINLPPQIFISNFWTTDRYNPITRM